MIGLKTEIEKRKKSKYCSSEEKWSIRFISKLIGTSYTTIKLKLDSGKFSVEESVAIFKTLIPTEKQTLEHFLYLFTNQQ